MRAASSPSSRVAVSSSSASSPDDHRVGLGGAQLALEEPLALLQAGQLGGDHAQEVAHLLLVEAASRRAERRVGHAAGDDGSGRENEMATPRA